MSTMQKASCTGVGLLVFALVVVVYARSVSPPPEREELVGSWIGYSEDNLKFVRLTLEADGTGLCSSTFVRDDAVLYKIKKWTLSGYKIEVDLDPVDEKAFLMWMRGKTTGWHLDLEIGSDDWDRELKLYRESDVLAAYERVTDRMKKGARSKRRQ